jgi:hypothetical protein
MNSWQLFDCWAPVSSEWSRWAKPILFAQSEPPAIGLSRAEFASELKLTFDPGLAVILDLPGVESIAVGLQLARKGFRPVPLFNGASSLSEIVKTSQVRQLLADTGPELATLPLNPLAPPVFLLDALRDGNGIQPRPGGFDNRWMVFPQDFPSARYLAGRGIHRIVLVQEIGRNAPREDLAHVLLRYQEAGLALSSLPAIASADPAPLHVARPPQYRLLWQRALAMLGLRRNSAGGFGSVIPQPTSG